MTCSRQTIRLGLTARLALAVALIAAALSSIAAAPSSLAQSMVAQPIVSGLSQPVFVTAPPGDESRLFVVEQGGLIRIFNLQTQTLNGHDFLNLTAAIVQDGLGERGLLGLAFHPDYANNHRFFVYFSAPKQADIPAAWDHESRLMEFAALPGNPDVADPNSGRLILRFGQPQANHNGGWLGFGPDGYLYIASGDGGSSNDTGVGHAEPSGNGQDITNKWLGKILRVGVDGDDFPADANRNYHVPPDNPYAGVTGDDEIWALGLRNPWRPSFDRLTGDLYIADVGQSAYEEIDFQPAGSAGGKNYGWRCMEGPDCTGFSGCTCNAPELTRPIYSYGRNDGCAVIGGYVYRGALNCAASGLYFFADLCSGRVWTLRVVGGVATEVTDRTSELTPPGGPSLEGLVSFGEDARGELYIVSQAGGNIFRIARPCPAGDIDGDCDVDAADAVTFPRVLLNLDTDPQHRQNADLNCDGRCDADDIAAFVRTITPDCPALDLTGDCTVTGADRAAFIAVLLGLNTQPAAVQAADLNGDGHADGDDIALFVGQYSPDCPELDIDGDCKLNAADVAAFVDVLLRLNTLPSAVQACDRNGDGQVNADDIQLFVGAFF